jgi:hypothetical protein
VGQTGEVEGRVEGFRIEVGYRVPMLPAVSSVDNAHEIAARLVGGQGADDRCEGLHAAGPVVSLRGGESPAFGESGEAVEDEGNAVVLVEGDAGAGFPGRRTSSLLAQLGDDLDADP